MAGGLADLLVACPSVIEEALLALQSRKPLYLAGLLGGASRQVIDALEGRDMPSDFGLAGSARDLYADPPVRKLIERPNKTV